MDNVIFTLIADEHKRILEKWGIQRHTPGKWTMILIEEIGEACEAFLERRELDAIQELVQAAAVVVAWIEALMAGCEEGDKMDKVERKVVSVGEFFRQRFNKMIGEPRSETRMGYNPPPQDPVRPKHPTPAPPKKG